MLRTLFMMCFYVNPQSRSLFQSPATLNLLDEFFSVRQLGSLIRRFKALSTVVDTSDTFTQQLVFLSLGMKLLCLLAALINVLQYSCEYHRKTFPSLQCFTFSTHGAIYQDQCVNFNDNKAKYLLLHQH